MPTHKLIRSDDEIDRVLNWAVARVKEDSRQPGESYEDGIIIMLNWLTGEFNVAPDEG